MMLATRCYIWTLGSHLLTTGSHRKKNKMRAFCNLNMHSFLSSKVLCVLSQQHLAAFGIGLSLSSLALSRKRHPASVSKWIVTFRKDIMWSA